MEKKHNTAPDVDSIGSQKLLKSFEEALGEYFKQKKGFKETKITSH